MGNRTVQLKLRTECLEIRACFNVNILKSIIVVSGKIRSSIKILESKSNNIL